MKKNAFILMTFLDFIQFGRICWITKAINAYCLSRVRSVFFFRSPPQMLCVEHEHEHEHQYTHAQHIYRNRNRSSNELGHSLTHAQAHTKRSNTRTSTFILL